MSRHSFFTILLLLWSAHGVQVNGTIDDSDPSIVYLPSTSWNSSQVVCSPCDYPPVLLALQQTFHRGAHILDPDADDSPKSSASPSSATAAPSSQPSGGAAGEDTDNDSESKEHGNDSDDPNKRSLHRRARLARLDADDPGFVDTPVFAQFNFTGTAVYVYCIQPLKLATAPAPPSLMNVSFSIDSIPQTPFTRQGSATGSGFASGVNVLAAEGLTDGPHALKLNLQPNSALLLDYIIVTQNAPNSAPPLAAQTSVPSPSVSALSQSAAPTSASDLGGASQKGTASFAGAVAGSLGVLGILCFGTGISILLRRKRAAKRERLERGNAPLPALLSGPASFIPRYFPGTVLHATPPTYDASESSHDAAQLTAVSEPLLTSGTEAPASPSRGYADIPPPDDAPPSFGHAITTPAVTILSSSDIENPPPRPVSWGVAPHLVALPESSGTTRPASLFTAEDEDDDLV
ncbi:hypothetical protein B0H11DRAFT_2189203 [Mycena galericulata]|nr:hypothetical protein B0H11DRAFT_2189203 [Mycena galericulata]